MNPDAEIKSRLQAELQSRLIEFATILDENMVIVESANSPPVRIGQTFDPQGVVSCLQANAQFGTTQVSIGAVLSYAEVKDESFPQFLEGADASAPSMVGLHPYDTGRNGFIRYVVTTVFSFTNPTKVVGYLLAGDLITGKMGIPGNLQINIWGSSSSMVTDGFVGVYMSDDETRDGWNVQSHAAMATISGMNSRAMSLDVDPVRRDMLDRALASGAVEEARDKNDGLIYVAQKAPNLSANIPGDQMDPPLILVTATRSEYWRKAFSSSMGFLAFIFAIDIFAVWMASCIFLEPLERLGLRIRKGKQLNMKTVERLKHRRHLIVPCLCIPLYSLGSSIYCVPWSVSLLHGQMKDSLNSVALHTSMHCDNLSVYEICSCRIRIVQPQTLSRPLRPLQHFDDIASLIRHSCINCVALTPPLSTYASLARLTNFKLVAAGQNVTAAVLADVQSQLVSTQKIKQNQFSLIVDINKKVIYDPNGAQFTGTTFNPHGLTTFGMGNSDPLVTSIILTHADYTKLNPPTFFQSMYPTTPPSKLDPNDAPQNDVLVRFAVVPISATDSAGGSYIVGALIGGDVANGINYIPETANDILDKEGYSAIYIVPNLDVDNGDVLRFQLMSSALRKNDTTIAVDLEVDGVQTMLMEIYNNPFGIVTKTLLIHGKYHFATARCGPDDYQYKMEGRLFIKRKTGSKCNIIVIQTADGTLTSSYADRVLRVSIVLVLCQCCKIFALFFLLYRAFQPFKKIILQQKSRPPFKERLRRFMHSIGKRFSKKKTYTKVDIPPSPVKPTEAKHKIVDTPAVASPKSSMAAVTEDPKNK